MEKAKVVIVYYSKYGHTKLQAEAVRDGVAEVADVLLLTAEEATARMDELEHFDAIIFGSATYMGNIAAEFKKFMEASVGKWFKQAWRDKIAGGFTNSSNFFGDKSNTMNGIFTFAMQQGMIWCGLGVMPAANEPESMRVPEGPGPNALNRVSASAGAFAASFELKAPAAPGPGDLDTARAYGRRIAEVAGRLKK